MSCAIHCRSCGSTISRSAATAATARCSDRTAPRPARNAPSNSKFVFGPAKWMRFLITPPPGRVLIHRDFCSTGAADRRGAVAATRRCWRPVESGDVYLGIAKPARLASRRAMSAPELKAVRSLFKTVVLGIQYGLGARSLAVRTGISLYEAGRDPGAAAGALPRVRGLRAIVSSITPDLRLEISTPYGWLMQCPPGINPRTVRNFPIQATGAEILHVVCISGGAPRHPGRRAGARRVHGRGAEPIRLRMPAPRSTGACAMLRGSCCAATSCAPTCS